MIERDLVIVGAGPAGMCAAISAYENGVRDILLLERDQYLGGILNQCVHTGRNRLWIARAARWFALALGWASQRWTNSVR